MSPKTAIPVIYYHSVGFKKPDWSLNFLTLELSYFEDQLKYFSKNFDSITLEELYKIRAVGKSKYKNPVVLTFDDGYLDNWQYAYPLLKKYGLKATIFVSPEFVDKRNIVRPNLEDIWEGRAANKDLEQWGFLSWNEMRAMEESGVIDIQSHTMSHTKWPVSDKIEDFHHPKADSLYTICNLFPDRKPWYIEDKEFNELIPCGYPLFEDESSVNARKVTINPDFIKDCISALSDYNFEKYDFNTAFSIVESLYQKYRNAERLIIHKESNKEYQDRLNYEIVESKRIIEEKLNKTVSFLCWPHGDNNLEAHEIAISSGYKATTWGNFPYQNDRVDRIPERIGSSAMRNNRFLTMERLKFKIKTLKKQFPYSQLYNAYLKIRY